MLEANSNVNFVSSDSFAAHNLVTSVGTTKSTRLVVLEQLSSAFTEVINEGDIAKFPDFFGKVLKWERYSVLNEEVFKPETKREAQEAAIQENFLLYGEARYKLTVFSPQTERDFIHASTPARGRAKDLRELVVVFTMTKEGKLEIENESLEKLAFGNSFDMFKSALDLCKGQKTYMQLGLKMPSINTSSFNVETPAQRQEREKLVAAKAKEVMLENVKAKIASLNF